MPDEHLKSLLGNSDEIKLDKKILDYIYNSLKRGHPKEMIEQALVKAGHNQTLINLHFSHIKKEKNKKKAFLIALLLIILITSVTFYFYKSGKTDFAIFKNSVAVYNENPRIDSKYQPKEDADKTVKDTYNRAMNYYVKKDFNRALDEFVALIELQPDNPISYFYLGKIYCRKGDYGRGIKYYETAINLSKKEDPYFYLSMARCLERYGFHDKALQVLNQSLYAKMED